MCLISKEVETVSGTKIFCGINKEKTRQITVYANTVENISTNNAMVLPVPFPNSVVFHNFEKYKDFFSDCEDCFVSNTLGMYTNSYGVMSKRSLLEVYDVGSYKVSLAHSLQDLQRVDSSVFELSKGLEEMLKKYYSNQVFGFIICKLVNGKEKYHPFAYSHNISNEKIFIPTRHYHDDNINSYYNDYGMFNNKSYTSNTIDSSPMFSSWTNLSNKVKKQTLNQDYADDWDHEIYLYNIDLNSNPQIKKMDINNKEWNKSININLNKIDFPLDKECRIFNKLKINGNKPNTDIVLSSY